MTQLMPFLTVLAMSTTAFMPAVQPTSSTSDTCIRSVTQVSHSNFSSRNDRHHVEWRADDCEVTIRFEGEPRFSDDFRTLESLAEVDPELVDVPKLRRLVHYGRTYDIQRAVLRDSPEGKQIRLWTLARSA